MSPIKSKKFLDLPVLHTIDGTVSAIVTTSNGDYRIPLTELMNSGVVVGEAKTTTIPADSSLKFLIYYVSEAGTFTDFLDSDGNPIIVTSIADPDDPDYPGDIEAGNVQLWGFNNVWKKVVTQIDLSAYAKKSEFNPVKEQSELAYSAAITELNVNFQSYTTGTNAFAATTYARIGYGYRINSNEVVNKITNQLLVPSDCHRLSFWIYTRLTSNAALTTAPGLASGDVLVQTIDKIAGSDFTAPDNNVTLDIDIDPISYDSDYSILLVFVKSYKTDGSRSTLSAKFGTVPTMTDPFVRGWTAGSATMTDSSGTINTSSTQTFDRIFSGYKTVNNIAKNSDDIADLKTISDQTIIDLDDRTYYPALTELIGEDITPNNTTSSTTVCFVVKELVTLNGKAVSAKLWAAAAGVIKLIHFRQQADHQWSEQARYDLTVVLGANIKDLSSLDITTIPGDCFGLLYGSVFPRYLSGGAATGFGIKNVSPVSDVYSFTDATFPGGTPTNQLVALTVTVETESSDVKAHLTAVEEISENSAQQITAILAVLPDNTTNGTVLYNEDLSDLGAISSAWENTTWEIVSGGISPTVTGFDDYIKLDKQYSIDQRSAKVIARLGSDTRFLIYTKPEDGNANLATIAECDVAAGKMRIYAAYNDSGTLPAVSTEGNFAFQTDRDYVIQLSLDKNTFSHRFSVIDTITGEKTEIEDTTNNAGRQHDSYAMCCYSGSLPIVRSIMVHTPVKTPHLFVLGDSISEAMGNGVSAVDGYAQKLVDDIGGAVSGRGGGNLPGVIRRIETEVLFIKPVIVMITIGTNSGNSLALLRQAVSRLQELGVIVYLNNIPMRPETATVISRNADIATVRSEYNIKGALFDVATAIGNVPDDGQDTSKFYGDLIHPLNFGNTFMFNRFAIDTPEIFY